MGPVRIQSLVLGAASLAALYGAGGARVRALDAPQPKAQSVSNIVETLVGGGSIEGYRAREANLALGGSQGLALSARGEVYFSDGNRQQVLKFDPATGSISLVAGDGSKSYGGDGLPATSASLNQPAALTFDAAGNLLIADRGNFVVRRVDALSGVITTIAGTGRFTGQVVGNDPPAPLGDGGPATSATFGNIGDLAVDSTGAVVVCDSGNSCVRKFAVGGTIATIAGVPGSAAFSGDGVVGGALSAKFNAPTGVATDATVNTVVGAGSGGSGGFSGDGGPATAAQIGSLGAIAFDAGGQLLVACVGANRIRRASVAAPSPSITTIAGDGGADVLGDRGPATGASLSSPRDLAIDADGDVVILDAGHQRIRRVDAASGFIDTIIGTGLTGFVGDRGPKQGGVLSSPGGATYDAAGNLYVADTGNNAVRRVAPDGTLSTFVGAGTVNGLGDGGPAGFASLSSPRDVLVVGGTLFIADNGNDRIRAVDLATQMIRTYADVSAPVAIVANGAGVLFVAHDDQVDTVDVLGAVAPYAGDNPVNSGPNPLGDGLPATNATLRQPSGLALNSAGELFIADTGNDRVRKIGVAPGRIVSTVAGGGNPAFPSVGDGGAATSASLNGPVGVAVDDARLVVADTGNHRIREVVGGVIDTICGTGAAGFVGDGDLAANAQVNAPGRMFLDGANVVFADAVNNRIRQITSALDIDPNRLNVSTRLCFAVDKRTGQAVRGRDVVVVKAGLPLPDGIAAANLLVRVDVVDLHQQTQFDFRGRQPRAAKTVPATPTPFDVLPPAPPKPAVVRYSFPLRGTSVAGRAPVPFTFTCAGTLCEELGRAGFADVTTTKPGTDVPVRVNITLGRVAFTGVATLRYVAKQDRGGSALTLKPR